MNNLHGSVGAISKASRSYPKGTFASIEHIALEMLAEQLNFFKVELP
jgi:hypothetical protein